MLSQAAEFTAHMQGITRDRSPSAAGLKAHDCKGWGRGVAKRCQLDTGQGISQWVTPRVEATMVALAAWAQCCCCSTGMCGSYSTVPPCQQVAVLFGPADPIAAAQPLAGYVTVQW